MPRHEDQHNHTPHASRPPVGMIVAECRTCDERVEVPNKGLGRASVAAWATRHQGHDVTRMDG